ncbi:uncharacterized protein DS421_5g146040 [Arachis hypogaea]|nr:uncharacterized protein DS421_5g146040 [Arachis hypogaea]
MPLGKTKYKSEIYINKIYQKDSKNNGILRFCHHPKQLTEVSCDLHLKNTTEIWYENRRFLVW